MENIIMPKYSEGDIIKINPKELGQVYSTYRKFFKLYNFNDENYSTNNLIEDYINVDFMIEHIAPHHIENIPLYVIVTEACKIRFLVNEQAIKEKVSHNPFYGDNQKYTTIYNITKNYYQLKDKNKELKSEVYHLKEKIADAKKTMPALKVGMFGKVLYKESNEELLFVVSEQNGKLILIYQSGSFDCVSEDGNVGFDANGQLSSYGLTAEIVTLYNDRICCFDQVTGDVNESDILWER